MEEIFKTGPPWEALILHHRGSKNTELHRGFSVVFCAL
jgi:hypothetical protein